MSVASARYRAVFARANAENQMKFAPAGEQFYAGNNFFRREPSPSICFASDQMSAGSSHARQSRILVGLAVVG